MKIRKRKFHILEANEIKMSIVIFGDLFSFPEGQAATNRIYTYAKGLRENGINVYVICFSNIYMDKPNGIIDGISYYNPFEQKQRSQYFFMRRWHKIKKYRKTYAILKQINKADKISAINRWSDTFITQFFGWVLALMFKAKVITECNEHPLRNYQQGLIRKKAGVIKFYTDCFFSHGILCISRYLENFHLQRGIRKGKLFVVPSTVDPSRFKKGGEKPIPGFYLGYFGSLTFKRDNVDMLIRAFAIACQKRNAVSLVLGGFSTDSERRQMVDLIEKSGIKSKVIILDYLTRQEIANYICHSDILVMVRAEDLESEASYPSKLTEFLATGAPVISVNVGEVSDFLIDGVNSFLVQPGNYEQLADKLNFVIDNYESLRNVGIQGRELTERVFNYNYQAKRIAQFIKGLDQL